MILGGRLCKQSAIALVSDTIIHHKEPVGDGVFWLFSEPISNYSVQINENKVTISTLVLAYAPDKMHNNYSGTTCCDIPDVHDITR